MPEGQFSGSRAKYEYLSDSGTIFKLTLDETLGNIEAAGLTVALPTSTAVNKPTGFKPRVVFWQGTLNGDVKRKEIVCGRTSTLYATDASQALTVDGVAGVITGRRGEKLTF